MADTLYADVSEFQVGVTDVYPYEFIAIRSNDGTYTDHHFAANLAWCKHAVDVGKLKGFIVYFVFEPNWRQTLVTLKANVGTPHRSMAVMTDVEQWSGKITGDHSDEINACNQALADWLGSRDRVVEYGNIGDLNSLHPNRPKWLRYVIAAYGSNPAFPGKLAHQYANNQPTAPFGPCDINSADGLSPLSFAAALGLPTTNAPAVKKHRGWQDIAAYRWRWIKRLQARIANLRKRKHK